MFGFKKGRQRKDSPPNRTDFEDLFDTVDALAKSGGPEGLVPVTGSVLSALTPGGVVFTSAGKASFTIRITGGGGASPYSWVEQKQDTPGVFSDDDSGLSGTTTEYPAYEQTGLTTVPAGAIVEAYPDPSGEAVLFSYRTGILGIEVKEQDGSPDLYPVTILIFDNGSVSNPSAGVARIAFGIEVKEADGTPDYTGIAVLLVDQAAGLSLSQPAAGAAQIGTLAASQTQAGVISLNSQTLGNGDKTFHGHVLLDYDSITGNVSHLVRFANAGGTYDNSIGWFSLGSSKTALGMAYHHPSDSADAGWRIGRSFSSTQQCGELVGQSDICYAINGTPGKTVTVTLAKITTGGANGSLTFTGGILTGSVAPT